VTDNTSARADVSMEPPVRIQVDFGSHEWQPLDVPIDEEEMDWGLDRTSDMDISPPSSFECHSSSASLSTQSSSGPPTPVSDPLYTLRVVPYGFAI
jgi:hypothetical protein